MSPKPDSSAFGAPPQGASTGVGRHRPGSGFEPPGRRLEPARIADLGLVPSLSSEVADLLDEWGWGTSAIGERLVHRSGPQVMVGHAVTLSYLPERDLGAALPHGHLAHHTAAARAQPGDVLVISSAGRLDASVLGGEGASSLAAAGMVGAVVDGAMRDLDEVRSAGISVWATAVSPRSGVGRLEAVSLEAPLACGGVQVWPGDLVVADQAGIVFVPSLLLDLVASRILGPG